MPPARAPARGPSRAPARGGAPARARGGATSAPAPGGAAVKVGGEAEKDPRFRKVIEQLEKGAKKTKQHPPASKKAAEAQAAAVSPPTERLAGAKANQVDAMKAAEAPKADPNGFLTLLRAEIEKVMPKTLDDADSFMEGGETQQVKGAVSGGVKEQKDAAAGPTEQATAAPPDPSAVPARQPEAMPEEPVTPVPPVNGAEAMPAPKPAAQVQALGKPKQDAEQQMKDAELTPERLKKANDPRFSAVMTQKGSVEKLATAAPGKYVAAEGATLGQAKVKASGDAKAGVAQMGGVKLSGNNKVKARQLLAKQKDEARRKAVTEHIEKLYQQTKQKVDLKLSTLEADVMRLFDVGAEAALADMKSYANREIDKFKDERYSGIRGRARWIADLFRPVPEGIKVILGQARTRFAAKMDALAVRISAVVDGRLAAAKAEVDKSQAAIKTYVDGLPRDLQAVGREAQQAMTERFDELRSGIDSKKNDLAQKLAQKYKEAHDKADAALKKLEEENAGALKKLADAIGEVIKILTEFKDKLMAVLRKGLETIKLILSDPIGFLGNLLAAIKQGFNQFVGNIWTHLKKGFMEWLFGSLAAAGIQVPADLNVWSILKLVLDVLGLTYAWMRGEAVKLMGERNVMLLEKLIEYITVTIKGGPQALWEKLKEDLSNLKAMVIDAIQNWLIETVIKQAVTKILSMFNPAGAIVQAIIAIYNVVMWVIENASRILALIEAVVNSVHAIATGAISGAAAFIEKALASLIPIVIAFLARLVGLGGLSAKIREFITKVQTKVRAAVLNWLKKAWAYVKKLFGGGGRGHRDAQASPDPGDVITVPFSMKGASHKLKIKRGAGARVTMASAEAPISDKIGKAIERIKNRKPPLNDGPKSDAKRIAALTPLKNDATAIETAAKGAAADPNQLSASMVKLIEALKKYAVTYDAKDIEDVLDAEFPPPEVGPYGTVNRTGPKLPDGKIREAHHAPPVELAQSLSTAMTEAGIGLNAEKPGSGKVMLDAGARLLGAASGTANSLPAILVHEQTHRIRRGPGKRIHGSEIRNALKEKLAADGINFQHLLRLQGQRAHMLSVKPEGLTFERQFLAVARDVAQDPTIALDAAMLKHGPAIIKAIYKAAAAQSLAQVELALNGSILDGPADMRSAAVARLRALATTVWEDTLLGTAFK
jgi:hypothetical protein